MRLPHDDRTWNIFQRRFDDELCCAVPCDTPLPAFLFSGDWNFGCQFRAGDPPIFGLCWRAADLGADVCGFHLFGAFATVHETRASRPDPDG